MGIWFPAILGLVLTYNLEAVAAHPKIFMGLALVHFQKYWLLSRYLKYQFNYVRLWKSVFWATVFTLHIKHHLYQELTVIYFLERKSSSERFSSSPFYKVLIGKSLSCIGWLITFCHLFISFFFYLPRYNIIAVA